MPPPPPQLLPPPPPQLEPELELHEEPELELHDGLLLGVLQLGVETTGGT